MPLLKLFNALGVVPETFYNPIIMSCALISPTEVLENKRSYISSTIWNDSLSSFRTYFVTLCCNSSHFQSGPMHLDHL